MIDNFRISYSLIRSQLIKDLPLGFFCVWKKPYSLYVLINVYKSNAGENLILNRNTNIAARIKKYNIFLKINLKVSPCRLQAPGHQVRCTVDIADTQHLHRRVDVACGHAYNTCRNT